MRPVEDKHRHQGLRHKLVDQLKKAGISDENVLQAIAQVPRHFFLDSAFAEIAYENRSFPIGEGQTISHPYTVAYQTQLLSIQKYERVLEVGTGSAYQAVVLATLGAQVYTIERQRKLFDSNKQFEWLQKQPGIKFFYGDGYQGLPTFAPFDKILITAAAPQIPFALLEQLRPGGWMVVPVGEGNIQQMKKITKLSDGATREEIFDEFSFVPMLTGKES
ncbi:MAG TPA: protein-L-isoaspartate O-methyltransferase [Chitinophagaceae bacterium]|jgi:protein-L-isoaspartate(D-aspartate) O-methyltransferase|nr:protein-L-isoaspartate(D-aspartate) O-methyltransferase [Chitinophagaceae bacterium]NCW88070.1 protein-L-isoaspartate(D-aspartate) O-methyltransferase [Chitinophagia bacterium]HAL94604.1 protein-L-isoaspartate O-methyltransferase [Chitinophagaceae bacterium]